MVESITLEEIRLCRELLSKNYDKHLEWRRDCHRYGIIDNTVKIKKTLEERVAASQRAARLRENKG